MSATAIPTLSFKLRQPKDGSVRLLQSVGGGSMDIALSPLKPNLLGDGTSIAGLGLREIYASEFAA